MSRKGKRSSGHFVRLSKKTLRCDSYKALSAAAKILYLYLKGKYNGINNKEIALHYSELKGIVGLKSSTTVSNAFKELIEKGWVKKTEHGGLYRYENKYELTWKYDDLD